jgi:hypothetical protein
MIIKYIIYSCYEHYGKTGIEITDWFPIGYKYNTKKEANNSLKEYKKLADYIDKKTKLKHFFEIRKIDITTLPVPTYPIKTKGRKSKQQLEKEKEYYENYWKRYE